MTRLEVPPDSTAPDDCNSSDGRSMLFFEVQLTEEPRLLHRQLVAQLSRWLMQNYAQVRIGQCIDTKKPSLRCAASIAKLQIVGHSESYVSLADTYYALADHGLHFFLYVLYDSDDSEQSTVIDGDGVPSRFAAKHLPHEFLEGKWESLIFDEPIAEDALRTITRSITLRKNPNRNRTLRSWISNILFYGPTGTGKTTMSLGLAQKLSIRLNDLYETTQLLEIHSHVLLSKYFGESGKQVGQLFESIYQLATDESQLIVVILDEAESLVSSREKSSEKNEVGDAVRSTNEFLRGLDRLSELPNVVFIATSNLHSDMDPAFLDRFPYQEYVGCPGVNAGYEILRGRINELITDRFVSFDSSCYSQLCPSQNPASEEASSPRHSSENALTPTQTAQPMDLNMPMLIPSLDDAASLWKPEFMIASSELKRTAALGEGLSGRGLENWVTLAVCKYTMGTSCTFWELLSALGKAHKITKARSDTKQPLPAESPVQNGAVEEEIDDMLDDDAEYERAMAEIDTDSMMA